MTTQHQILKYMKKNRGKRFTSKLLTKVFKVKHNYLTIKLEKLHKWNFIKRKTIKTNKPYIYWF